MKRTGNISTFSFPKYCPLICSNTAVNCQKKHNSTTCTKCSVNAWHTWHHWKKVSTVFSYFTNVSFFFYEKGFQKNFKIHITDSFPRYHCMLFFGVFEDRKTHTNRVVFFPKSVLNFQWCAAGINRRIYDTISGFGCQLAGWLKLPWCHVIIFLSWKPALKLSPCSQRHSIFLEWN